MDFEFRQSSSIPVPLIFPNLALIPPLLAPTHKQESSWMKSNLLTRPSHKAAGRKSLSPKPTVNHTPNHTRCWFALPGGEDEQELGAQQGN